MYADADALVTQDVRHCPSHGRAPRWPTAYFPKLDLVKLQGSIIHRYKVELTESECKEDYSGVGNSNPQLENKCLMRVFIMQLYPDFLPLDFPAP